MKAEYDQERLYWIDAIRSFACICVVTTHAAIAGNYRDTIAVAFFNYYSMAGASILFFMISGALILYKPKPVVPFLKTRFSRVFFPMVVWSIVSLTVKWLRGKLTFTGFLVHLAHIPFWPQVSTYWFIYVILGIYLLTPILANWLTKASRRDVEIYLGIWGLTLLLPYVKYLDRDFLHIVDFDHGYLYQFYGFTGYALMGYYLRKYVDVRNKRKFTLLFVAALALPMAMYLLVKVNHYIITDRMSFHVLCLTVCYFSFIKQLKMSKRLSLLFYDFAQHSFGIYLVHIILMKYLVKPIVVQWAVSNWIQIPVVIFSTVVVSYIVVHLLSKLPYSKYVVGL